MLHFSNHYLYPLAHWGREGGIAAVSPSKYALVQRHCTNNNVTYLQSQQQLQLEQSCSVIVERCLEQHRFYLSPERSVRFSSSDRRRQSIPGPRSGHWKCSIAKYIVRRVVGTSSVDVDPERRRRCDSTLDTM